MKSARCSCGARVEPALTWCPQCHASTVPEPAEPPDGSSGVSRPWAARPKRRAGSGLGRWDASPVTYGLYGRLIATVLVTLPMLAFLYYLVPFGFVGIICYATVYPKALRDVWRRSDRL